MYEFKNSKIASGTKPCLTFAGEPFADTTKTEFQRLKSLLVDFFRGPEVENVRLAGIEHVLQFTAVDNKVTLESYDTDTCAYADTVTALGVVEKLQN